MNVRPMKPGEERLWVGCGALPDTNEERLNRFRDSLERNPEQPVCFLMAVRDGTCIGKLRGSMIHANLYVIRSVTVDAPERFERIGSELVRAAIEANRHRQVEAMNWKQIENEPFDRLLRGCGFSVFIEKSVYTRSLVDYVNPWPDPFEYRSLSDTGDDAFVEVIQRVHSDNPNRDAKREDPAGDLRESIDEAGQAFDPSQWWIAVVDGWPVGFLLPQIFPDSPEEGTIFNIGIVPEFRGRGWGKVLHARGLKSLADRGATEYIGSTDLLNAPMRKLFDLNQCREIGIRRIYRYLRGETT